ncbi:MAG: WG repeat-containing protein, partial [Flavobacteriales bacterium]|nr:WG repeat-containing protein [Flavobacteriales bacterium]
HEKWGYCDYDTKLKIPYNFESVEGFVGEFAIVNSEGKYGLVNKKGTFVIEPIYETMEAKISLKWFVVQLDGKFGVINLQEEIIISIQYDKIEDDGWAIKLYQNDGFEYLRMTSLIEE